jgi:hypothetical protein
MSTFTRDVTGQEVEMKLSVPNVIRPGVFIKRLEDVFCQEWNGFIRQWDLGTQDTNTRSWSVPISYHGVAMANGDVQQVLMLAHGPLSLVVLPTIKVYRLSELSEGVLSRYEDKTHAYKMPIWKYWSLVCKLEKEYGKIKSFGRLKRTKWWFYITCTESGRNYSVTLDYVVARRGNSMIQLELEYKGRQGEHAPEGGDPIRRELGALSQKLSNHFGFAPTTLTKLQFLLQNT